MVGGGPGSFIGGAHRRAANLDGKIELVAGCFSRDPAKGAITGAELFLDPERVYTDYKTMFEKEAQREDKIDLVSIVTPNAAHFEVAIAHKLPLSSYNGFPLSSVDCTCLVLVSVSGVIVSVYISSKSACTSSSTSLAVNSV